MWRRLLVLRRRYQRKWKQVPFHDRLNVVVAAGSFFVGIMAVVLTVVALRMSQQQGQLARVQTELSERQFKILERQLQRDARLSVRKSMAFDGELGFLVRNWSLVPVDVSHVVLKYRADLFDLRCRSVTSPLDDSNDTRELRLRHGEVERMAIGVVQPEKWQFFIACRVKLRVATNAIPDVVHLDWMIDTFDKQVSSTEITRIALGAWEIERSAAK